MPGHLDLQSEPFSATGGAAAEGVSNQLGRPRADRFTVLVREAIQNSWDARLALDGGVRFQIDGYLLEQNQREAVAAQIFAKAPFAVDVRARLLGSGECAMLAISDFGTRGLSGPTRGDVVPQPGEATNFVDFMRYIGRPPNRAHAGGTYGFGKAAYFLASSLRTICVYTRFSKGLGTDSRFMAAALGPQFETGGPGGQRFTGRHWWGRLAQDNVVDPVVGDEADALALLLGGVQRDRQDSGTTVYILAPDFEGLAAREALSQMGRAITDYFWPKLIDGIDATPTMSFSVRWQGDVLPLPGIQDEPELALLAQAFAATSTKTSSNGAVLEPIASQRPKKLLGHVAFVRRLYAPMMAASVASQDDVDDSGLYEAPLRRPLRHVAVMRAPNFVVKYLEGPAVPYELAEYAGVFRVDADADAAFARAEPPTHDDWVPDLLLDAAEKTYVRVALRKVKDAVAAFAAPHRVEAGGTGQHSVASFSRLLGGLVPALNPDAARPVEPNSNVSAPPNGGANRRSSGRARRIGAPQIAFVGETELEMVDGTPAMIVRFEASSPDSGAIKVSALPKVVIADGFESDPPEGALQPQVLKWLNSQGSIVATNVASCSVPADNSTWTVVIGVPPDAMISVTLKAEAGTAE
jgi:hypothetical protein